MDKGQIIREMVEKFVEDEKPFTSVDVGNAVKRKTLSMDVRNREVAAWLRKNASTDNILQDYDTVPISVNDGQHTATLYFPHWTDPEDYAARDQKALGPDDISDLRQQAGLDIAKHSSDDCDQDSGSSDTQDPKTATTIPTTSSDTDSSSRYNDSKVDIADLFDDGDQYNPDGDGVRLKKRLASVERLWIPSDITKAVGLSPGDNVDISKIKIHSGKLNPSLKVHYDGRFAIPRRCVGYGTDPVKVMVKGDEIFFEKA
jgi:hypothetical protein